MNPRFRPFSVRRKLRALNGEIGNNAFYQSFCSLLSILSADSEHSECYSAHAVRLHSFGKEYRGMNSVKISMLLSTCAGLFLGTVGCLNNQTARSTPAPTPEPMSAAPTPGTDVRGQADADDHMLSGATTPLPIVPTSMQIPSTQTPYLPGGAVITRTDLEILRGEYLQRLHPRQSPELRDGQYKQLRAGRLPRHLGFRAKRPSTN